MSPEGCRNLPDYVKSFLKTVPNNWDEVQLLDGYPGKDVIMARRKDKTWYIEE